MSTIPATRRAWTREEVYELVWSQPMTKLIQNFGICDRAIAKNCKKLKIPVPGRGYWARKAAGYKDLQPPLPPLHERIVFEWRRRESAPTPTPAPQPRPPTPDELLDQREIDRIDQLLASGELALKRP